MEEPVIKGKNVEISQALRDYIAKKVERLSRHLDRILETKVELAMEETRSQDDRYAAQITIFTNHTTLRTEERGLELRSVIDLAIDRMDRQIDRYKAKLYRRNRKANSAGKPVTEAAELVLPPEEVELSKVVRQKRFPMKPMYPEEAAEQMELLGHGFFVFFNAGSGHVSVIYRRRDGNYGLLEPELG